MKPAPITASSNLASTSNKEKLQRAKPPTPTVTQQPLSVRQPVGIQTTSTTATTTVLSYESGKEKTVSQVSQLGFATSHPITINPDSSPQISADRHLRSEIEDFEKSAEKKNHGIKPLPVRPRAHTVASTSTSEYRLRQRILALKKNKPELTHNAIKKPVSPVSQPGFKTTLKTPINQDSPYQIRVDRRLRDEIEDFEKSTEEEDREIKPLPVRPRAHTVVATSTSEYHLHQRIPTDGKNKTQLTLSDEIKNSSASAKLSEDIASCARANTNSMIHRPSISIAIQEPAIAEESASTTSSRTSVDNQMFLEEIEPRLKTEIGNIYADYFGHCGLDDPAIKQHYQATLIRLHQAGINESIWQEISLRARKLDKYTAALHGCIGSLGYALLNGFIDIMSFAGRPVPMPRQLIFQLVAMADYLSGRIPRAYFQQAYYTKTTAQNLPDIVTQKKHLVHPEKWQDFFRILGTYMARNAILRLPLNQGVLHTTGNQRAWEIANSAGDNVGGLFAGSAANYWVVRNSMYTSGMHPLYLLERLDSDKQIAHLRFSGHSEITLKAAKNFAWIALRDLPKSLLDMTLSVHGLLHSIGTTIAFESIITMYAHYLPTPVPTQNNIPSDLTYLSEPSYSEQLRAQAVWLDSVKLLVGLPILYAYLIGIALHRDKLEALDNRICRSLSRLPGVIAKLYSTVSQKWFEALTPVEMREPHLQEDTGNQDLEGQINLAYTHSP